MTTTEQPPYPYPYRCPRGHRWAVGGALRLSPNTCPTCGWGTDENPEWDPYQPEHGHPLPVVVTDGGRSAAGFTGKLDAGDCVARAAALASGRPYREVYDELAFLAAQAGGARSARGGVTKKVTREWFETHGWAWTPTMSIGSGCTVHLCTGELPPGRLVVQLSKHVAAVLDGVVHDNHNPTRGGTRCVYGYWTAP